MSKGDVAVMATGVAADYSSNSNSDNSKSKQLVPSPSEAPSEVGLEHRTSTARSSSFQQYSSSSRTDDDEGEENEDEVDAGRPLVSFKTEHPSEEETVLTSASSHTSLSPENPLYINHIYAKNAYDEVLSSYRSGKDVFPSILQQQRSSSGSMLDGFTTSTLSDSSTTTTPNLSVVSALLVDRNSSRPVFRSPASRTESLPPDFHKSPEPLPTATSKTLLRKKSSHVDYVVPLKGIRQSLSTMGDHHNEEPSNAASTAPSPSSTTTSSNPSYFRPQHRISRWLEVASQKLLRKSYSPDSAATWIGFWALMLVTCANYVLTPMRDAIALAVGVEHIPNLTLASTILAVFSSVPIGWLFEAPDPKRRKLWKLMGLTRGETQGTSLALFYRCFALSLFTYSCGFKMVELVSASKPITTAWPAFFQVANSLLQSLGHVMYIAFFLMVHLMKLHSLSLIWGVTTEAMDYEDVARNRNNADSEGPAAAKSRLQRLGLVSFGGTLGGILGSVIASSMAHVLRLSGLLVVSCVLLEISAELSIELGRIMRKHWEEQQLFKSTEDLASLDPSMKRSTSVGSMKRVASGNSLHQSASAKSLSEMSNHNNAIAVKALNGQNKVDELEMKDNTFYQRLLRGITTILRSRLLMAIFTYNALYASTTVLLSFQRAVLVANRNTSTNTEADTVFLANINMASSVAIFALQASGAGAYIAHSCGPRGTLTLMPLVRLLGVLALAWWHRNSNGRPPNLLVFLILDECTKVMNLAVAKPVRESLWRGLSNEARYEAKPIVDTLANRWGGGSAAFLVAFINKCLDVIGVKPGADGNRSLFGFPPILFLCMVVAAWWAMVSADLGQIRRRIDIELKKHQ